MYELVDHCKTKLNVEVKYQMDKNYSVGGYVSTPNNLVMCRISFPLTIISGKMPCVV